MLLKLWLSQISCLFISSRFASRTGELNYDREEGNRTKLLASNSSMNWLPKLLRPNQYELNSSKFDSQISIDNALHCFLLFVSVISVLKSSAAICQCLPGQRWILFLIPVLIWSAYLDVVIVVIHSFLDLYKFGPAPNFARPLSTLNLPESHWWNPRRDFWLVCFAAM